MKRLHAFWRNGSPEANSVVLIAQIYWMKSNGCGSFFKRIFAYKPSVQTFSFISICGFMILLPTNFMCNYCVIMFITMLPLSRDTSLIPLIITDDWFISDFFCSQINHTLFKCLWIYFGCIGYLYYLVT